MSRKYTLEKIRNYVDNNSKYILLSTEYINNKTKLKFECDKQHIFEMSYSNFQQGQRCPVCANNQKYSYDYVYSYFKNEGYELLSNEYIDSDEKLNVKCPNNHNWSVSFRTFKNKKIRCSYCYGNNHKTQDNVKNFLNNYGYLLLSEFKNVMTKVKMKCPKGHLFEMRLNNFQQGQRCPKCSCTKKFSIQEKEIVKYIQSFYNGKILENDRKILLNNETNTFLELDIYLPDIKKAIEFNSEFWHSSDVSKKRDYIKQKLCNEKNIRLYTIWYNDYMKNKILINETIKKFIENV